MPNPRRYSSPRRRLRIEPLEDRRVLAAVVVTNNLDTVDGDTSSLAALEATPGDDGISIREAIEAANNTPGADEITFDFGHDGPEVILLTEGELEITDTLTITGDGAALLTFDAENGADGVFATGDGHRIFQIDDGDVDQFIDVALVGLTLTGGDANSDGGAIRSYEVLAMTECVVTSNSSFSPLSSSNYVRGGGVSAYDGKLTIVNSKISDNRVDGHTSLMVGGGISATGVELSIVASTLEGNWATSGGGGIFTIGGDVTVRDSQILANGTTGNGGGIFANGNLTVDRSTIGSNTAGIIGGGIRYSASFHTYTLRLLNSTVNNNLVYWRGVNSYAPAGGGIAIYGGAAEIVNSTVSGNRAVVDPTDPGFFGLPGGGGIVAGYGSGTDANGPFTIVGSTITKNFSHGGGGGMVLASPTISMTNSIVANNRGNLRNGADMDVAEGRVFTASHSLIGDRTGTPLAESRTPDANGNLVGTRSSPVDPHLGPLADHGGPTMTHALLPESPALDAGDPAIGFDPTEFDQRGEPYARVADGGGGLRIDIGAYESQGIPGYPVGDYNHDGIANIADYTVWRDTLGSTTDLAADGNENDEIDAGDYTVWKQHFGNTEIPLTPATSAVEAEAVDAALAFFFSPEGEADAEIDAAKVRSTGLPAVDGVEAAVDRWVVESDAGEAAVGVGPALAADSKQLRSAGNLGGELLGDSASREGDLVSGLLAWEW